MPKKNDNSKILMLGGLAVLGFMWYKNKQEAEAGTVPPQSAYRPSPAPAPTAPKQSTVEKVVNTANTAQDLIQKGQDLWAILNKPKAPSAGSYNIDPVYDFDSLSGISRLR